MIKIYTIHDLEISKEIVATLSYIALSSGIKFSSKIQFNYIIYKLYNYLKEDFNFENGIRITETLKTKINEFKTIHDSLYYPIDGETVEEYYCTFPKYAQNDSNSPYLEDKYTTLDEIEASENRQFKTPYKFWNIPKGTTDYCSVQLELKHKETGVVTKTIVYTSYQSLSNLDYWEIYLSTNSAKTAYSFIRKSYNTEGTLFKTEEKVYSTSFKPTEYDARIYKVYGDIYPIECWIIKEGVKFDDSDLLELDSSSLIDGDLYYAKDFALDEKGIDLDSITQKHINGVFIGFRYGAIKKYLGTISKYDSNEFKFLTITSNKENTSFTGYVSTYPLYVTNLSGELGFWFIDGYTEIPVKVFKSEDGEIWKEIKSNISSYLPYNGDSITVKTTALSYAGEDVIYSNYPIMYSYKGDNFTDESFLVNMDNTKEGYEDLSPYATETDYRFIMYRNADEDFTLDMLPLGVGFYYGRHKIEDSPRFKTIFRPSDYTNNLNVARGIEGYYPKDAVYCDSLYLIDYLTMHNYKNYSKEELNYKNTHLFRWLNSDAPEGEWWEQINEFDLPSTSENMYTNYKNGYYGHRAGFLYNFSKEEKDLLIPFNIEKYEGCKVVLIDKDETPRGTKTTLITKLNQSGCATNLYFVNEMKYHLDSSIAGYCSTELNVFASTYKNAFHWSRTLSSLGSYSDLSTSNKYSYYVCPVRPVICLSKDVKVKKEPDEFGIFSLELPVPESVPVEKDFDIDREVLETKVVETDIERNVIETISKEFDIERLMKFRGFFDADILRNIAEEHSITAQITRDINRKAVKDFDVIRNRARDYSRNGSIVRDVIGYVKKEFSLYREVRQTIDKTIDILRDVKLVYEIDKDMSMLRNVVIDVINEFGIGRNVAVEDNKDYDILRDLNRANVFEADVLRDVRQLYEYEFDIERKVKRIDRIITDYDIERYIIEQIWDSYQIEREIHIDVAFDFDIIRDRVKNNIAEYQITRDVLEEAIFEADVRRDVLKEYLKEFDIERLVVLLSNLQYDIERNILETFIKDIDVDRDVLENIEKLFDSERNIVENIEQIHQIIRDVLEEKSFEAQTLRDVLQNFNSEVDILRDVLNSFDMEADIERNILVDIENNAQVLRDIVVNVSSEFDIEREINTDFTYVSRENLDYYTRQLKKKIDEYINIKVESLLEEKLRERLK